MAITTLTFTYTATKWPEMGEVIWKSVHQLPADFGAAMSAPVGTTLSFAETPPWATWCPGAPIPTDEHGVPRFIRVLPQFAGEALKVREQHLLAAWLLLRAADPAGSGQLSLVAAARLLKQSRGVGWRQARRILQRGAGSYWRIGRGRVFYVRNRTVADRFGINRVSRERLIDSRSLVAPSALRAAFSTTVYATDDSGVPLTRRHVAALTGVCPATQRRYENTYGNASKVAEVHVRLTHREQAGRHGGEVPEELGDFGFYRGKSGDLMRRHGDIRRSHHGLGARGSARRLNRELRLPGSPASKACGERPVRTYFPQPDGTTRWLRAKRALGKQGTRAVAYHPMLDYSVVCRVGRRGQRVWQSVAEPKGVDIV